MSQDIVDLGMRVDTRGLVKGKRETEKFGNAVERTGKKSSVAAAGIKKNFLLITAAVTAAVGALRGLGAAINTISNFERSMSSVAAVTRASASELEAMRDIAKELGSTTEFTASQAADGLKFLGMAGFEAKEAVAAIPDVLDLATASGMGLARAADIASNVMSAFRIEAENAARATDALAAIASRANTDVEQLGDAMKFVGPVASAVGLDVEKAAAAIGVLSDNGLQGSMAGTGLRRVLSSLLNPTDEARAILEDMGLAMEDLNPETNELTDIIGRLAEAGLSAGDALTIFGDRGAPAVLALTANTGRLNELTGAMSDVEGEASRMADTMRDNLGGDIDSLRSAVEGLIVAMGEAGLTAILRSIVQAITFVIRAVTGLVDAFRALKDSIVGPIADLLRFGVSQEDTAEAIEEVTGALSDEVEALNDLNGAMPVGTRLSVEMARAKLNEARAIREKLAAANDEARMIAMQSEAYQELQQEMEFATNALQENLNFRERSGGGEFAPFDAETRANMERIRDQMILIKKEQEAILSEAAPLSDEWQQANDRVNELEAALDEVFGNTVQIGAKAEDIAGISQGIVGFWDAIAGKVGEGSAAMDRFRDIVVGVAGAVEQMAIQISRAMSMLPGVSAGLSALSQRAGAVLSGFGGIGEAAGGALGEIGGNLAAMWSSTMRGVQAGQFDDPTGGGGGGGGSSEADQMHNQALDDARRLYEATRTEAEKYATELERINQLHDEGYIDADTYSRAIEQLDEKYNRAGEAAQFFQQQTQNVTNSLVDLAFEGGNIIDIFRNVAKQIAKAALQAALFGKGPMSGLFGGGAGLLSGFFANGTNNAPGGLAVVGERGPELVNLPKGSQVIPNDRTSQMLSRNQQPAPQQMPAPKIVNVLDPNLVGEYLTTAEGEQVIMNVVSRNQGGM